MSSAGRRAVQDADLLARARSARSLAHAPYSGFAVGAALAAADGRVFVGANLENASHPASICAERVALSAAVMAGARELVSLAVIGPDDEPLSPCGLCRQVLHEFAPDLRVLLAAPGGTLRAHVLDRDLLPAPFSRADLEPQRP